MKGRFETKDGERWFRMARPSLSAKEGEVQYPTGVRYNGGTVVNGKWVQGFLIAPPKVPAGFSLRTMGVGLQLNSRPPYATQYLERSHA